MQTRAIFDNITKLLEKVGGEGARSCGFGGDGTDQETFTGT